MAFPLLALLNPIGEIISGGIGIVGDWLKHKREVAEARAGAEIAIEKIKVESVSRIAEGKALHEIDWEKIMAKSSETSWKDEFVTIVISLPFLAAFFGQGQMATRAFVAMQEAPEWYTYTFIAVFLAAIGIRVTDTIFGMLTKHKNGNGKPPA